MVMAFTSGIQATITVLQAIPSATTDTASVSMNPGTIALQVILSATTVTVSTSSILTTIPLQIIHL